MHILFFTASFDHLPGVPLILSMTVGNQNRQYCV